MNKIFRITFLAIATIGMMQSCTKVSEPYYTAKAIGSDSDTNKRAVLLEDYTGHLCVNCAPAARLATEIHEAYPGEVFVIAVHAGDFAKPNPVTYKPYLAADYRTQAGNDWNSSFGVSVNPSGMVNRRPYNGTVVFGISQWFEAVKYVSDSLPKLAIMTVKNEYSDGNKQLSTKIGVKFLQNLNSKITLTVCMLEDSIYGGQKNEEPGDSTPIVKNYRFMHMLRGSLNGSFGEEIVTNPAKNQVVEKSYSYDFTSAAAGKFVPLHCSIIAFISDADTKEVLHVAKAAVRLP